MSFILPRIRIIYNDLLVNVIPGSPGINIWNGASGTGFNTGLGYQTLANTSGGGVNNTAVGYAALNQNTTGFLNTAVGFFASSANLTGHFNTSIGYEAGKGNTAADGNTALGAAALTAATGGNNLALGFRSGVAVSSGAGNIIVGQRDNAGNNVPVFTVTTENNRIVLGHTAVTNAYIQVPWTVVSDARDKTDIEPLNRGLAFVQELKPIMYRFRKTRERADAHGPLRAGFLAQDIVPLEDQPMVIDQDDPDKLKIQTDTLVPILVRAIQELTQRVALLEQWTSNTSAQPSGRS